MAEPRVIEGTEPVRRDIRHEAFLLYATEAGRSVAQTAAMLGRMGQEIPERTLRYWRQVDRWDERADEALLSAAGTRLRRLSLHLLLAAESAANWLEQVNRGLARPDPQRLAAARVALAGLAMVKQAGYLEQPVAASRLTGEDRQRIEERYALVLEEALSLPPGSVPERNGVDEEGGGSWLGSAGE